MCLCVYISALGYYFESLTCLTGNIGSKCLILNEIVISPYQFLYSKDSTT
uniref:Uncharacterized protein n=1 Tax=Rhizophora mucronata TaxID=61149 RepID=A0A2P2PBK7_RHIMU